MKIQVQDYEEIADKIEEVFTDSEVELSDSIVILMTMVSEMIDVTNSPEEWYKHLICKLYFKMRHAEKDERVAGMLMQ